MQFKNQNTRRVFNTIARKLDTEAQIKFLKEVRRIADIKILSESDNFTICDEDLKSAFITINKI